MAIRLGDSPAASRVGEEVTGLFFCEAPIRPNYIEVYPGNPPATTTRDLWRLTHYYLPPALPVSLVHIMTESRYDSRTIPAGDLDECQQGQLWEG